MNIRKTILTLLVVLAVIALFVVGCGCDGQCPFKKMFGGKSAESKQPCGETTPTPAPETK